MGTERTYCLNYETEEDLLYVGTLGGGIVVVDPLSETVVRSITEGINHWINSLVFDSSGTLWIGTADGHWCYSPDGGQLFRADLKDTGLMHARTNSIAQSKDGAIWLGTGEGLIRLDRSNGEVRVITEKDGLSSNVISGIPGGNGGSIWVSTAYGLTRIRQSTGQSTR